MNSYKDLLVWQKSMDVVTDIYKLTQSFPKEEMYGITSQIRRAVVSIPSNIAEGQARKYNQQFYHFLAIANGSIAEVETQLELCKRLGYVKTDVSNIFESLDSIGKMISKLQKSILKASEQQLATNNQQLTTNN